jgi:acetate kinase
MAPASTRILTINGGSSSIKFSAFVRGESPRRNLSGMVDRIGLEGSSIAVTDAGGQTVAQESFDATDYRQAAEQLATWLASRFDPTMVAAVGHRVVHGGPKLVEHRIVTEDLISELRRVQPLDLAHLPHEIAMIEVFRRRFAGTPQVVCFDTEFFRNLPDVAKLFPIPRKFSRDGIRRLGFHGLSYTYLMSELQSIAPTEAAGRVILAHLGSGASMTAIRGGKPSDTSMAFTPTAGLVMGTRPGDLDPGLLVYLMREEQMTADQLDDFVNQQCGLIGVSETTSDMRDLIARRNSDSRAADAVEMFCYQAKKYIGAYAAMLGGLDSLVFSGGIGEHASEIRAKICEGLEFLGVCLDPTRNASSDGVISAERAAVVVRVIPTDEEIVIARAVNRLVDVTANC